MKKTSKKSPSQGGVPTPELKTKVLQAVENYRVVAAFLRNFADQAAIQPEVHSEIVKSATLVRIFLEKEVIAAEKRFPCPPKTKKV